MTTTSIPSFPPPAPTSILDAVSFSPSPDFGKAFQPFGEALFVSAECVTGCSATDIFVSTQGHPCYSTFYAGQLSMMSEISTETDTAVVLSLYSEAQEQRKTYVECLCGDKTLEPWLAGPTGVCDETCQNQGEDLVDLERIHTAFSNLCGLVGVVEATTTASGAVENTATATEATKSGSESSKTGQPEATGSGEPATVSGSGATGKIGITVIHGLVVATVLGLCIIL